jgi:hypothetical protein
MYFIGGNAYGGAARPSFMAVDIADGSDWRIQDWTTQTTGCEPLIDAAYPGLAYDPAIDRVVGWPGSGDTVYVFDHATKACTARTFPGGPTARAPAAGTFGRFRYVPSLDAFVVLASADDDAYLLRLGDAAVADTTRPQVALTAPAAGTVAGMTTVAASAGDDRGVAGVQFLLDGVALGAEDTVPPYAIAWDTRTAAAGTHALTARARDAAGNAATSAAVQVDVANAGQPPPGVKAGGGHHGGCGHGGGIAFALGLAFIGARCWRRVETG